jgi:hypothetical protein
MATEILQPIYKDYKVVRGRLLPVGKVRSQYNPLADKRAEQLATEFAKLHDGDADGLRRFARGWGLLGWRAIEVRDKSDEAEPANWIWGHAKNARTVLEIREYLIHRDHRGLAVFLNSLATPMESEEEGGHGMRAIIAYGAQPVPVSGRDTEEAAKSVITGILNPNLLRTRDGLREYIDPDSLELKRDCIYLLAAVYWQLARIVADRQVSRCQQCDAIFVVTDKRQKYCPPARGKSESICAARARKADQDEESTNISEVEEEEEENGNDKQASQ